jgi:CubicO group peptidase (beta-lactamase class C family)
MIRISSVPGAWLIFSAALVASEQTAFRFPRSSPEAQGVSSKALLEFVEAAEARINSLHSFMLIRHGKVVVEGWWAPYSAEEPHQMFSLSKSFTSTAIGLTVADGKVSVDDPVLKFFPEEAPAQPGANLKAMRVRDLLTMATGQHSEDIQNFPYHSEESVVKKFLALPVAHKPGTFFLYNSPASYMLSAIVQKVSGQSVLEYLRPRLFDPLGIESPTWEANKQGVSMGGFGLNIRTEDIARFGQLYLQRGKWQGKQLVPDTWVDSATSRWMSNGSSPTSDWEQGYGFQFWRCRHGFYRGDGAHGQFCIVMPQYDAVIAITSGTRDMASVMNLVWEKIVPALQPAALAEDAAAQRTLSDKMRRLALPQPTPVSHAKAIELTKKVAGKRFVFPQNPLAIETMRFEPGRPDEGPGGVAQIVCIGGVEQRITAVPGAWRNTVLKLKPVDQPVAIRGAWTADDTYTLEVVESGTPFRTSYRMKFSAAEIILEAAPHLGPASAKPSTIIGKAE